ncbi:MAG: ATP-dependent DNA helicase, partial [Thermoprotei archaeon]
MPHSGLAVEELNIDPKLKDFLLKKGIRYLYPPQVEALSKGVLEGKNIVLASHTASGKTLIAELLFLKKFLEGSMGKAVYMVPLKAIASEKYEEFKELKEYGVRIALTTGDYDS